MAYGDAGLPPCVPTNSHVIYHVEVGPPQVHLRLGLNMMMCYRSRARLNSQKGRPGTSPPFCSVLVQIICASQSASLEPCGPPELLWAPSRIDSGGGAPPLHRTEGRLQSVRMASLAEVEEDGQEGGLGVTDRELASAAEGLGLHNQPGAPLPPVSL